MKFKVVAEVEYESREELVEYVCGQVSQLISTTARAGMDPSRMFAEAFNEMWLCDWKTMVEEHGDAVVMRVVRDIVELYSTEKLEEIANFGYSVAANGILQEPEVRVKFAVVIMSAITKGITGTAPNAEDGEDQVSDVHKAIAAYMNEVSDGCSGVTGEDFTSVMLQGSRRPPIILSAKVDMGELGEWFSFLEEMFDDLDVPDVWDEIASCCVGEEGGMTASRLCNINFVIYLASDPNSPVGVADTIEHAKVVHDWFANKGEETVVIALSQMAG